MWGLYLLYVFSLFYFNFRHLNFFIGDILLSTCVLYIVFHYSASNRTSLIFSVGNLLSSNSKVYRVFCTHFHHLTSILICIIFFFEESPWYLLSTTSHCPTLCFFSFLCTFSSFSFNSRLLNFLLQRLTIMIISLHHQPFPHFCVFSSFPFLFITVKSSLCITKQLF